jgi:HKD family nuclease
MVQYTSFFQEDSQNPNCVTGDEDHLYDRLKLSITRAKKIKIIVAFLMESGVRLLINDLKEAVDRGTDIRILCGNYLNITQPQALYLLKGELGDRIDLRFYNVPNRSFHPKAYIFEYEDGGDIYVGSSNISRSALTNGIEWNYRISQPICRNYRNFKNIFKFTGINFDSFMLCIIPHIKNQNHRFTIFH